MVEGGAPLGNRPIPQTYMVLNPFFHRFCNMYVLMVILEIMPSTCKLGGDVDSHLLDILSTASIMR